jgi:hypothetical protein
MAPQVIGRYSFNGHVVEGIDVFGVCEHPTSLYDAGEDGCNRGWRPCRINHLLTLCFPTERLTVKHALGEMHRLEGSMIIQGIERTQ